MYSDQWNSCGLFDWLAEEDHARVLPYHVVCIWERTKKLKKKIGAEKSVRMQESEQLFIFHFNKQMHNDKVWIADAQLFPAQHRSDTWPQTNKTDSGRKEECNWNNKIK